MRIGRGVRLRTTAKRPSSRCVVGGARVVGGASNPQRSATGRQRAF